MHCLGHLEILALFVVWSNLQRSSESMTGAVAWDEYVAGLRTALQPLVTQLRCLGARSGVCEDGGEHGFDDGGGGGEGTMITAKQKQNFTIICQHSESNHRQKMNSKNTQ